MSARNTFAATRRSHAILKRLRRGEGITINDVSDEFGIQYPQARADLKLLEELYDLNTYRDGRIKVWEMPDAGDPTTHVGIAAALELGGVALDIFRDTPYGERIDELAGRWRRTVRPEARQGLERLSKGLMRRQNWLPTDHEGLVEHLELCLDAIRLRRGIEMSYERSDGEQRQYVVIPRLLIWYQGRLWLQAVHDERRKLYDVAGIEEAIFVNRDALVEARVDAAVEAGALEDLSGDEKQARRQQLWEASLQEVEAHFELAENDEENDYFQDAFGIFATGYEPRQISLVVRGAWANYLSRYRLHPSQENEPIEEGLRVRFELGLCPEFKSFVQSMIPEVTVEAPLTLRDELQTRVAQWKAMHG